MDYFYEAKTILQKVKHAVLNLTEMESKVMEATNGEKWGASSTLMQEIAKGTFHFQQFNEVMNIITKRLTEREPERWRHVYKALTLLEYLIKNGSEKVVDYSRSHISIIKSLRSFNYIDEKGKDQGINVKNRSKEIVDLLSSTEKIKEERKKAKANKSKYVGIGSEPTGFSSNSMNGFGSGPSYSSSGIGSNYGNSRFEESVSSSRFNDNDDYGESTFNNDNDNSFKNKQESPLPPTPNVEDLFSFDEPEPSINNNNNNNSGINNSNNNNDDWSDFKGSNNDFDDFGDFQSISATNNNPQTSTFSTQKDTSFPLDFMSNDSNLTTSTIPVSATQSKVKDPLDDLLGEIDSVTANNNKVQSKIAGNTLSVNNNNNNNNSNKNIQTTQATQTNKNDIWSQHSNLFSLDNLSFGGNNSNNNNSNNHQKKPSMNSMYSNNNGNMNNNNNTLNFNNNNNNNNSIFNTNNSNFNLINNTTGFSNSLQNNNTSFNSNSNFNSSMNFSNNSFGNNSFGNSNMRGGMNNMTSSSTAKPLSQDDLKDLDSLI